ncbi:MAG: DNA mismatch repair protein MutS [Treponema sp.]|jgi:DNA mismatch repair protein MutS|nr:DNA mismatch repair protein MutS [Treponema sp.]
MIASSAANQNSGPMLDQYRRIKNTHQGEVLFFRLGDFYEMFADDAIEVSSLLNLTLTSRSGQPMCGIPYHAARTYIARLLKLGKKIAICEQIAEQTNRRPGPMERKVVEVITPGTTVEEDYLDKGSSNYLGCFASYGNAFSFAYIDLSAGDFFATSFAKTGAQEQLSQELERLQIKEIIVQESLLEDFPYLAAAVQERSSLVVNRWADWLFDIDRSSQRLKKQFNTTSLKGFGLEEDAPEIIAAGALLDYLDDTARSLIPHIRSVSVYKDSHFVGVDEATQKNLELIRNLRNGDSSFTLFEVMDECRTAMGRRLLKFRILHPLRNCELIRSRLDAVDALYHKQEALSRIREYLGKTPDLERLSSRIAMDRAHGKDMVGVKNALEYFFRIEEECKELKIKFESQDAALFDSETGNDDLLQLKGLHEILENSLTEDPSILLTEGNLIKSGYDPNLDELHQLRDNGRGLLEAYLEEEKLKTGIPSLKIRYNRMIGYYFEVTKNHLAKVPSYFIRRQGIVAGERYTTDRLAELESNINGASERIVELEKNLFLEIRSKAKALLLKIIAASRRIAELDAAQSLARAATIHAWNRPVVDNENRLFIAEGRHPVVEANLPHGEFIPNDVILVEEPGLSFALITGPNMAGKSTYLRQAALIMIMAQAGSFVPASKALVGMADRIYCRVGASDNLARGESTFLVEMIETAYILRSATERSLVIMDEVGRGTGTKDGLSIAWAVCEEILNRIKCRTLFATHYHELSMISHPCMANRSMEIEDNGGEIVFLRKLKEGPAAESYGLHVASLAGLPKTVLERAGQIMDELDKKIPNHSSSISALKTERPERKTEANDTVFVQKISKLDINALSPLEALNLLSQWKDETLKGKSIKKKRLDTPGLFD